MDRRLVALLALTWLAPLAPAQTLARFAPPAAESAPGWLELRHVRERAGQGTFQPWPGREIGWLFVREEGTQQNHDSLAPSPGDPTLLRVERETTGAVLAGWDLPARVEQANPGELRAFLAEHMGAEPPPGIQALLAREPVPVLRLESLALVVGAAASEPSAVAVSKSGQRMELRALFDPTFVAAGSDFAFKLYLPEGGAEHVHARAVHLEDRSVRAVERLGDGSLRARLDRPGPWMLEATRVRALDGSAPAALELASSTLVFVVRAAQGGKGGGR